MDPSTGDPTHTAGWHQDPDCIPRECLKDLVGGGGGSAGKKGLAQGNKTQCPVWLGLAPGKQGSSTKEGAVWLRTVKEDRGAKSLVGQAATSAQRRHLSKGSHRGE